MSDEQDNFGFGVDEGQWIGTATEADQECFERLDGCLVQTTMDALRRMYLRYTQVRFMDGRACEEFERFVDRVIVNGLVEHNRVLEIVERQQAGEIAEHLKNASLKPVRVGPKQRKQK